MGLVLHFERDSQARRVAKIGVGQFRELVAGGIVLARSRGLVS